MKLFDISQTEHQLLIKKRILPKLFAAIFMVFFTSGMFFLLTVVFFNLDSWSVLGWFQQLPVSVKRILFWFWIFTSVSVLVAITLEAFLNVFNAWRGDVWVFDLQEKVVKHLGETVVRFGEVKCMRVEEDRRGEGQQFMLSLKTTADKEIRMEYASFGMAEMIATAQQIKTFTGIETEHEKL